MSWKHVNRIAMKLGMEPIPGSFDPATLGDGLALETEWTPLPAPRVRFPLRLVDVPGWGLKYKGMPLGYLFCAGFVIGGIWLAWTLGPRKTGIYVPGTWPGTWEDALPFILGFVFSGMGVHSWAQIARRRAAFDFTARTCLLDNGVTVPFADVYAIQILFHMSEDTMPHQLNLVRRDGTRAHVMSLPSAAASRDDAARIAELVGCKVWDSTAAPPEI